MNVAENRTSGICDMCHSLASPRVYTSVLIARRAATVPVRVLGSARVIEVVGALGYGRV